MASERKVSVKVDLSATGNLGQVAYQTNLALKAVTGSMAALTQASASAKPINMIGALSAWQNPLSAFKLGTATASPVHPMMAALSQNKSASNAMIEGMSAPARDAAKAIKDQTAATAKSKEELQKLSDGAAKTAVMLGSMQAAAVGFVAAASPAAFQTFTGSVQLAAGQIGIMLIPAITRVSLLMQGTADFLGGLNKATFGLIGRMASAVAVPVTIVALGAAAVAAAARLKMLAASGGPSGSMAALTGVPGKGGLFSRFSGRAFGVGAAASIAGDAIGGTAGSYLSAAGTGAMIGSIGGPIGAAVGAGVGLLVNAISKGFASREDKLAKLSLNFTSQRGSIETMWEDLQAAAVRDPMQQAQFDQQMTAQRELIEELRRLNRGVVGLNGLGA